MVAHIGLTPQSVHSMGGYRVQGKTLAAMDRLSTDARALEDAGAIAIVLEGIPRELAARITHELAIPTIGIGAGPDCDGQILVFHDLFNLTFAPAAKFTRQYADGAAFFSSALDQYRDGRRRTQIPLRCRELSPSPRGATCHRLHPTPRPQGLNSGPQHSVSASSMNNKISSS